MSDIQRNIQIFRDNAKLKADELRKLSEKKNQLLTKPDLKESRLKQDVAKAQRLLEKYQEEMGKTQSAFEKAQKEHMDAQEKATRASDVFFQTQKKLQEETNRNQRDREKDITRIDVEIRSVEQEQRSWEAKATNEERNLQLEFKKNQEATNSNLAPSRRDGRRQNLR